MEEQAIGIGILGGTGYGAGELLRLLTHHPYATVTTVTSRSQAGQSLDSCHKNLAGFYNLTFESELNLDRLLAFKKSIIFSALPHGTSLNQIQSILDQTKGNSISIIDLSGDLRLKDPEIHSNFYSHTAFTPEVREQFVYGLPEINRQKIKTAQHVCNPGCYPTASVLSVAPLVTSQFKGSIYFDAKSGTSGAGRKLTDATHHSNVGSSIKAYKPLVHQHEPEIRQALGDPLAERISTMFVPQLLPIVRGIMVTSYLDSEKNYTETELYELYTEFYKDSPFVRVCKEAPSLRQVIGSNFCDIYVTVRDQQVLAVAVEDNLIKGMAGQAIQNMNLLTGLPETTGLWFPGLGLV